MKIAITGATGNVGTSLLAALDGDGAVEEIVGIARRRPGISFERTRWVCADVTRDDLTEAFAGVDAVVHLAWLIQPSRDRDVTYAVNVEGSRRVFEAAAAAGVSSLVHASSIGAYSPGPKDRRVDESWPTGGIQTSFYSRDKADVETILDTFERAHPEIRVVRLRPGLIFKGDAASGIRRLFAGPLLPTPLLRRRLIPVVPALDRLRFQAVHSLDIGEAYKLALLSDVRGPFNIAAEPVLGGPEIAGVLGARYLPVPRSLVRGALAAGWHAHLVPADPRLLDLVLGLPLLDTSRAADVLGWKPKWSGVQALREMVEGLADGAGGSTEPLAPDSLSGRRHEVATGIGERP